MSDTANEVFGSNGQGLAQLNQYVKLPTIKKEGFFDTIGDRVVGVVARTVNPEVDVTEARVYGTQTLEVDRNGKTVPQLCLTLDVLECKQPDLIGARARIYLKKQQLSAVVNAANAAQGHPIPQEGALITITFTEERPTSSGRPYKVYSAEYKPEGTYDAKAVEMSVLESEIKAMGQSEVEKDLTKLPQQATSSPSTSGLTPAQLEALAELEKQQATAD